MGKEEKRNEVTKEKQSFKQIILKYSITIILMSSIALGILIFLFIGYTATVTDNANQLEKYKSQVKTLQNKNTDNENYQKQIETLKEEKQILETEKNKLEEEKKELNNKITELEKNFEAQKQSNQQTVTTQQSTTTSNNSPAPVSTNTKDSNNNQATTSSNPATTQPVQKNNSQDYVLNTNTKKFHISSCSSIKQMKDSNKKYYTGSRDDVIKMGYTPCQKCNP
jgi:cell division protein FtsN